MKTRKDWQAVAHKRSDGIRDPKESIVYVSHAPNVFAAMADSYNAMTAKGYEVEYLKVKI